MTHFSYKRSERDFNSDNQLSTVIVRLFQQKSLVNLSRILKTETGVALVRERMRCDMSGHTFVINARWFVQDFK